jgi:hypothetical protein
MCLNGRVMAAAALAVTLGCGASMPPPEMRPVGTTGQVPKTPPPARPAGTPVEPQAPHAPPVATASLAGRVVDAGTHAPLSRARVTLTSPAISEPRIALSGRDGTYSFRNLPAGAYSVVVTRTGYAPQQYGERRTEAPLTVPVAAGQNVTGIDVSLQRAGVIVGQILDEDNVPFAGAIVDAVISRTERGQPTLLSVSRTESDDRGEFRLIGLAPGQYYVTAFDPAYLNVGDETGPLSYTPTYYPGVVFVDQATRVTVTPGAEPSSKIVFSLKIVRPARVSGQLSTLDRRQLISGAVIMSPVHGEASAAVPTRDVTILPDGTFSFRNVPPGRYQIRARGEIDPNGVSLFSTFSITVEGHDVSNLDMTLVPGASVEGTLTVEATSTPKPLTFDGIRVRAPFADGTSFGDAPTGDVRIDGSYRIRGLMPGSHYVTIEGLPYPWVLKSVVYRGRDITDASIEVESRQALKDVRVTITDAASEITGVVRDERGQPAPDALVMFIPTARHFWTRTSRRFGLLRTDAAGRFRIRGLPSGEYHAVATFDVDESEALRRDLLHELVVHGVPISLGDRGQRTIDIPLVAFSTARRTVSR